MKKKNWVNRAHKQKKNERKITDLITNLNSHLGQVKNDIAHKWLFRAISFCCAFSFEFQLQFLYSISVFIIIFVHFGHFIFVAASRCTSAAGTDSRSLNSCYDNLIVNIVIYYKLMIVWLSLPLLLTLLLTDCWLLTDCNNWKLKISSSYCIDGRWFDTRYELEMCRLHDSILIPIEIPIV